jgi:hypothetical protein
MNEKVKASDATLDRPLRAAVGIPVFNRPALGCPRLGVTNDGWG